MEGRKEGREGGREEETKKHKLMITKCCKIWIILVGSSFIWE